MYYVRQAPYIQALPCFIATVYLSLLGVPVVLYANKTLLMYVRYAVIRQALHNPPDLRRHLYSQQPRVF